MGARRGTKAGGSKRARPAGDGYWLEQVEAWARSGEPATVYAKRAGISVGAFYEAKRRLIARGRWSSSAGASREKRATFARVMAASEPAREAGFRVRLPSGATLEWASAPGVAELATLLGRLCG